VSLRDTRSEPIAEFDAAKRSCGLVSGEPGAGAITAQQRSLGALQDGNQA
jgi:hypothetical protein